jgi:hypothetical protein
MRVMALVTEIRRAYARRVTADSASSAQLAIDHLRYEPADLDTVLAALPKHTHMQDAPSSHLNTLLTDEL